MKKEDEPDFYKLDKSNPLPTLEESPLPSSTVVPPLRPQQGLPGGMPPQMHGIGAPGSMPGGFKDPYGPRDGLMGMGMGQGLPPNGFVNPAMGMNPMNPAMGMNPMSAAGIDNLRDPQFAQQGMGEYGSPFGGPSAQLDQYQRIRQLQQMQLLERQMGGAGQMPLSNDPFAMMRQQC